MYFDLISSCTQKCNKSCEKTNKTKQKACVVLIAPQGQRYLSVKVASVHVLFCASVLLALLARAGADATIHSSRAAVSQPDAAVENAAVDSGKQEEERREWERLIEVDGHR